MSASNNPNNSTEGPITISERMPWWSMYGIGTLGLLGGVILTQCNRFPRAAPLIGILAICAAVGLGIVLERRARAIRPPVN